MDSEWRFTFLNGAAERLLQRPRAELIGQDWRMEFSAAVDSAFGKEYRRAIADNQSVAFEEFYPPLKTWFSVRAYPSREGLAVYFLDITERRRTEKALRESEAQFRTLAEAMPQMVWITDPDGGNVYFNQQWMDYTGLTLEESRGDGWNKPFHPEDQQRAWQARQHATATVGTYPLECRLRRADGIYRWWLMRGVPMRDADGNPRKWFGTCTDIHDLKMAEMEIFSANRKLTESDENFRQLADTVTDVFWMTAPDMQKINYVSPAYEQVWGRSVESLYADPQQWFEAILPEERERVYAAFAGLGANETTVSVEYQIARPDGVVRWICSRGFQVQDTAGKVIRLTGIASDITERKHSEQATQRALRRLNDAQRIGQIGDWEYDLTTQAITWSPQVFEILGRDPSLGPPRDFSETAAMYDAASSALMEEKIARAIESGKAQQYELQARRPGGEKVDGQAMAVPRVDDSGRVVGLYGTIQDISERKRHEQEIEGRVRQQKLIATLGHSALANTDLDNLFTEAGSAIAQGLKVEFSRVIQLVADDRSFILKAGAGGSPLGWGGAFPPWTAVSGSPGYWRRKRCPSSTTF